MVKTTKIQKNKKIDKKIVKKTSNVNNKKIEIKKQEKDCSCRCVPCCKENLALKIFFLTVYSFVILLFLTMWSKLYNKQLLKDQKCLVSKLYCCGYGNKKECTNWEKYCREKENEKLNCNLGQ